MLQQIQSRAFHLFISAHAPWLLGLFLLATAPPASLALAAAAPVVADPCPAVCGAAPPATPADALASQEACLAVCEASRSIDDPDLIVAVSDRPGNILAVWERGGPCGADRELAASLARTAAFFSNGRAPLSSRTVRFISGIHFPPGIENTPAAALYGIENTNRGCSLSGNYEPGQAFPRSRSIDGTTTGPGIATGKLDVCDSDPGLVNGGGLPLFKPGNPDTHPVGLVVGGVGVVVGTPGCPGPPPGGPNCPHLTSARTCQDCLDKAEFAAFFSIVHGGFLPNTTFHTNAKPNRLGVIAIQLDGIRLPFIAGRNKKRPARSLVLGSFSPAGFVVAPRDGTPAPEGWLVLPRSSPELTDADVEGIVQRCIARADRTRAGIRLLNVAGNRFGGERARMVIAVSDLAGNVLGLYRMADSTIFSVDVAVTKARNVVYFSGATRSRLELPGVPFGTAMTNRSIEFGAQPLFPSGINGTSPGPFFALFKFDLANPCTQGSQPANPNQSGIVFFPGALPLYRNGLMVGGLGVSGDGVEQDDYVTAAGAQGYEAPDAIRADQVIIDHVRLPYLKFPRNPEK